MIDFICSTYFLGILLVSGSCMFFVSVFIMSWFEGKPRRFWLARLTYDEDKDKQKTVRFMWLVSWLLAIVGALLAAIHHPASQHTLLWVSGETLYIILMIWALAKAVVILIIILVQIKDWVLNDKRLFSKSDR